MMVSASGVTPIDFRRHFANSGIERERRRVRAASALVILLIACAIIGVYGYGGDEVERHAPLATFARVMKG
jgi:hypothetical protein